MAQTISIGKRIIGDGHPAFVIAEIAQAHDGSLGYAHSFIDLAKQVGADAVKFQTHIADEETTREEQFRINIFPQDKTRFDYWKRMEFTPEQWKGLYDHAAKLGIIFLSSPFSIKAVDILEKIGVPAWKVASGEVTNHQLLNHMSKTGKPIMLSTGMSKSDEIKAAIKQIKKNEFAIFQCTTKYPTPIAETGLNVMEKFKKSYRCPVGLSDHSANPYVPIAAMARGASLIEAHLCFHRAQFGPDTSSSLAPEQFKMVTEARDVIYELSKGEVDKDAVSEDHSTVRGLFTKSLALKDDATKGTVVTKDMVTLKKPGNGLPPSSMKKVVGRRLTRNVQKDELLREEYLEK